MGENTSELGKTEPIFKREWGQILSCDKVLINPCIFMLGISTFLNFYLISYYNILIDLYLTKQDLATFLKIFTIFLTEKDLSCINDGGWCQETSIPCDRYESGKCGGNWNRKCCKPHEGQKNISLVIKSFMLIITLFYH